MTARTDFKVLGESAVGPNPRFGAVQQDVGNGGQTGPSADEAQTAVLDPYQT
jgi:hypothetical protein